MTYRLLHRVTFQGFLASIAPFLMVSLAYAQEAPQPKMPISLNDKVAESVKPPVPPAAAENPPADSKTPVLADGSKNVETAKPTDTKAAQQPQATPELTASAISTPTPTSVSSNLPGSTIPVVYSDKPYDEFGEIELTFKFKSDVQAAFLPYRGKYLLVFPVPQNFSLDPLPKDFLTEFNARVEGNYAVIELGLVKDVIPLLQKSGNNWKLTLGPNFRDINEDLDLKFHKNAQDPKSIHINFESTQDLITLNQGSFASNPLYLVPHIDLCVRQTYRNPEFTILPTVTGFALRPNDPALTVAKSNGSVDIATDHPLYLHAPEDIARHRMVARPNTLLNISKWEMDPTTVQHTAGVMLEKLSRSNNREKLKLFKDISQLYLANGFYAEALATITNAQKTFLDAQEDDLFKIMYDLSSIMAHRYKDFDYPQTGAGYEEEPEYEMIKGLAEIQNLNYGVGLQSLIKSLKLIQYLPKNLRNDVALAGYEASAFSDTTETVFKNFIVQDLLSDFQKEAYAYYQAKFYLKTKDFKKYQELLGRLKTSPNKLVQLLARMDLIDVNQKTVSEGIKELEDMQNLWRGDRHEYNLLKTLQTLYEKKHDPWKSLGVMRVLCNYFLSLKECQANKDKAANLVYQEFMKMSNLHPLKQIGFIHEFEDLMPRDKRFIELTTRLVKLYVDLDLLEQGLKVIKRKLEIIDKEKTNNHMDERTAFQARNKALQEKALLSLKLSQYEDAQQALSEIVQGPMDDPNFGQTIQQLKGQLLIAQNKYDEAIPVLKESSADPKIQQTLADIYITQGKWAEAVQVLEPLTQNIDDKNLEPLLDLAVVYASIPDEKAMEALQTRFADKFKGHPQEATFKLLTTPLQSTDLSKKQIEAHLQTAEKFKGFFDNIQKTVLNDKAK